VKCITLVRRAPGVEMHEFGSRWRQDAEALFARAPSALCPNQVIHAVVRQPDRRDAGWHGVAISWFSGADARSGWDRWCVADHPSRDRAAILDVEATETITVTERVAFGADFLIDRHRGSPPGPGLLLVGFIERLPSLSRIEFADYWWHQHRPLANRRFPATVQPTAYVHNYVITGDPSHWDGIGEMYESSLDAARQRGEWFKGEAARELIADEERFLIRRTREVLVTDYEVIVPA
jgi:hypothetical protein